MPTCTERATPLRLEAGSLLKQAVVFERMLAQNPARLDAFVGISLIASASGQHGAAIEMARAAVAQHAREPLAWVTLGQALKAGGERAEAARACEQALALDSANVLARLTLGEIAMERSEPERALLHYDTALRLEPQRAASHLGRGHVLACLERHREALACYRQALDSMPGSAEAEFAAGFSHARLRHTEEAEACYRRALALRPDFAAAWSNLGSLLREEGRDLPAEAALEAAVRLRPEMISGWVSLALLKRDERQFDQAELCLRRAFALDAGSANTHLAWCQLRMAMGDLAGAWQWLRWALAQAPEDGECINTHGILLYSEGRFQEAVKVFEAAERLGSKAAATNRANSLMELGQLASGLAAHRTAAADDAQNAGAAYNLALAELRMGDWRGGWQHYEARWRFREVHRAPVIFMCPRWRGEPLEGRTILLHAEQGLGDAIQFSRYVPWVVARGGRVVLQVHEPLLRLFGSMAAVRAGDAVVAPLGKKPPHFDLECPLMSLPAVFGTMPDSVPWQGPYLAAEPATRAARTNGRPRIGIAWAGNPKYKADQRRSTQLATLLPLIRTFDAAWISLQKGEAARQLADAPRDAAIADASSGDRDLADTAKTIASLDLVISTDTCIPHVAGAMGKPVWLLLPHLADWRWMEEIETSPWYPSMRLFRQRAAGDWAELVGRVNAALACFRTDSKRLHSDL